jgi:CRISPR-associated protein Cas6
MPIVDVSFRLQGNVIPVDHGYYLLSALSDIIPEIHGHRDTGVHPIAGRLIGDRLLALTRRSFLTLRLDSDRIGEVLGLAGETLRIGQHKLTVGVPSARPLVPCPTVYSRLVTVKGFEEGTPFLDAVRRQMDALDVKGQPSLIGQPQIAKANVGKETGSHSSYLRRTVSIKGKEIVGFALRVAELTAEGSIRLQEKGLGGRRLLGCGIFIPDRR